MKLTALAAAIVMCNGSLSGAAALKYATAIIKGAAAQGVDPLLVVAIVDHESRWRAGAVSPDGEDHGLGQIRARYLPGCAKDKDPVHAPSSTCKAEKTRLLDGESNLAAVFQAIGSWKAACKAKTGSTSEASWLTAYAGLNRPTSGKWCGLQQTAGKWSQLPIPSVVRAFLKRRQALRLQLEVRPPSG